MAVAWPRSTEGDAMIMSCATSPGVPILIGQNPANPFSAWRRLDRLAIAHLTPLISPRTSHATAFLPDIRSRSIAGKHLYLV